MSPMIGDEDMVGYWIADQPTPHGGTGAAHYVSPDTPAEPSRPIGFVWPEPQGLIEVVTLRVRR